MKNDFCDLPQGEIHALQIPDTVKGFLLSPFQFSQQNGFVYVPTEAFKEMIDLITAHAKVMDARTRSTCLDHGSESKMKNTFMNEIDLADMIRKEGIPVLRTTAATAESNAFIEITNLVHVSVPSTGKSPCVVRETESVTFIVGPEQPTFDGLIDQIRFHLQISGHKLPQPNVDAEIASFPDVSQ
ncbi:TPA: hypothetical protein L5T32_004346 [Pseudomonas aeruginosa]|nr:hypothetical protein [Pseudomonas aeruginosa]